MIDSQVYFFYTYYSKDFAFSEENEIHVVAGMNAHCQ